MTVARMIAAHDCPLTVTTPWYPTPYNRMAGSFVAEHAVLSTRVPGIGPGGVHVVHGLEWPGGGADAVTALRPSFDTVLDRLRNDGGTRLSGVAGPVDRVPVFTVGGADWGDRGEALVRDVRRVVAGFGSPVVHGHVGYLGGLLAARLAAPGAKVFATEHSTALRDVLAQPGARENYAELLERATAVFCVSSLLRDQVLERLPQYSDKLVVLPNPVDFAGAPRRSQPPERLSRWVFVGGLSERKGVVRLVKAFTVVAREHREVSLTLFGGGALAEQLVEIARGAGVADRLHLPGVVRHRELLAALPGYDLLLAPSTYETFHLAVPEAVAAGLPVIVTRSGGPQEALAGVEARVGTFIDVNEDPGEIVAAWRELSANLDRLDLDGAAAELDVRYGREAIAARLAQAYGEVGTRPATPEPRAAGTGPQPQPPPPDRRPPVRRVVLVSVSGWRRYHVEAELEAARRLRVPTTVVSNDEKIISWSRDIPVVAPKAVDVAGAHPIVEPAVTTARRAVKRLLQRGTAAVGLQTDGSAPPPVRVAALTGDFLAGATLVIGDCQSMPLVEAMLTAHPTLRPVVELDRTGPLGPPPDSEAGGLGGSGAVGRAAVSR